jgi:hypothetical protein
MRAISQSNMLLRTRTELPEGLRIATDEFRDGWNFLQARVELLQDFPEFAEMRCGRYIAGSDYQSAKAGSSEGK